MSNNDVLEKFLKIAVRSIQNVIVKPSEITFKCNICGDSSWNVHSKRGRLYLGNRTGKWLYYCFNGGCPANGRAISAEYWLERTNNTLHKEYLMEILTGISYKDSYKSTEESLKNIKDKVYNPKHERNFVHILKDPSCELSKKGIAYCDSRLVPKEIYERFYICSKGKYKNRLIIPFYDTNNKAYYYQGRSLTGESPKYLNKIAEKSLCLYNIYQIDRSKPVILTEGVFDSIFIENSIATLGVKLSDQSWELIKDLKRYFLFDNDEAGIKSTKEYLSRGEYIFQWDLFRKHYGITSKVKDVNDAYIYLNRSQKFTFEELERFFTNNYYSGLLL